MNIEENLDSSLTNKTDIIITRMTKPLFDEDIFTCNEAWSDMQGWVNGSLRSADKMLENNYGLESITKEHPQCKLCAPVK